MDPRNTPNLAGSNWFPSHASTRDVPTLSPSGCNHWTLPWIIAKYLGVFRMSSSQKPLDPLSEIESQSTIQAERNFGVFGVQNFERRADPGASGVVTAVVTVLGVGGPEQCHHRPSLFVHLRALLSIQLSNSKRPWPSVIGPLSSLQLISRGQAAYCIAGASKSSASAPRRILNERRQEWLGGIGGCLLQTH